MSDRFCPACSYCLNHINSARCPECGRPFNPADPATYHPYKHFPNRFLRALYRIPAWPFFLAGLFLLACQLYLQRLPYSPPLEKIRWLWKAWLVLIASWMLAGALLPLLAAYRKAPQPLRPPHRLRWILFIVLPAAAMWISHAQFGFAAAFFLSRTSLSNLVARADHDYPIFDVPARRVGLFNASEIYSDDDTLLLVIAPNISLLHSHSAIPPFPGFTPLPWDDGKWFISNSFYPMSATPRAYFHDHILVNLFNHPEPKFVPFLLNELTHSQSPNDSEESVIALTDSMFSSYLLGRVFHPHAPFEVLDPPPTFDHAPLRLDLQVLSRLGPLAVPGLISALNAHAYSPRLCIVALGLIGVDAHPALASITPYLKNPDPYTRASAAWAIRMIDSPACSQFQALADALDDPDVTVSFNVLLALEHADIPAAKRVEVYARYWKQHVAADMFFGPTAIPPLEERLQTYVDNPPPPPSNAEIMAVIEDRIHHDGLPGNTSVGSIAEGLEAIHDVYTRAGETGEQGTYIMGFRTPYTRPRDSETFAAEILAAIGPPAKSALPALLGLIEFRLRPDGKHAEILEDDRLDQLISTAVKLDPSSSAIIVATCVDSLRSSRSMPLHSLPYDPVAVADGSYNDYQKENDRRSDRTWFRQSVAELLHKMDPDNRPIRDLIAADLQLPVSAPQRAAAIEIAGLFPQPRGDLNQSIRQMMTSGDADSLLSAIRAAAGLKTIPPEIVEASLARIQREPDAIKLPDRRPTFNAMLKLALHALPAPQAADFLQRLCLDQPRAFNENMREAIQPGDPVIPQILPFFTQQNYNAADAEPYYTTARTLEYLNTPRYVRNSNAESDLFGDFYPEISRAQYIAKYIQPLDPEKRAAMLAILPYHHDEQPPPEIRSLEPVLYQIAADPAMPDDPLRLVLSVLVRLHWNEQVQSLIQENLASSNSARCIAAFSACTRAGDASIPFLMAALPAIRDTHDRARVASDLLDRGAEKTLTTAQVGNLIQITSDEHLDINVSAVKAILHADGTADAKAEMLGWFLPEKFYPLAVNNWGFSRNFPQAEDPVLLAANGLQALRNFKPAPILHDRLLHLAHGSPDEKIRLAARATLKALFP